MEMALYSMRSWTLSQFKDKIWSGLEDVSRNDGTGKGVANYLGFGFGKLAVQ